MLSIVFWSPSTLLQPTYWLNMVQTTTRKRSSLSDRLSHGQMDWCKHIAIIPCHTKVNNSFHSYLDSVTLFEFLVNLENTFLALMRCGTVPQKSNCVTHRSVYRRPKKLPPYLLHCLRTVLARGGSIRFRVLSVCVLIFMQENFYLFNVNSQNLTLSYKYNYEFRDRNVN